MRKELGLGLEQWGKNLFCQVKSRRRTDWRMELMFLSDTLGLRLSRISRYKYSLGSGNFDVDKRRGSRITSVTDPFSLSERTFALSSKKCQERGKEQVNFYHIFSLRIADSASKGLPLSPQVPQPWVTFTFRHCILMTIALAH